MPGLRDEVDALTPKLEKVFHKKNFGDVQTRLSIPRIHDHQPRKLKILAVARDYSQ